jgi:hypothetical protein
MTKHGVHEELYAGDALAVVAIRRPNGSCPVLDWATTLTDSQWAGIQARVEMFAHRGWLKSPGQVRKLADDDPAKGLPAVLEIKHTGHNLRLYLVAFSAGDKVAYVTHGTTKPKKNGVAREVARARSIYQEMS